MTNNKSADSEMPAELRGLRETFALATVIEEITLYCTDSGPRKWLFQRSAIRLGGTLRQLASCEKTISDATRKRQRSTNYNLTEWNAFRTIGRLFLRCNSTAKHQHRYAPRNKASTARTLSRCKRQMVAGGRMNSRN